MSGIRTDKFRAGEIEVYGCPDVCGTLIVLKTMYTKDHDIVITCPVCGVLMNRRGWISEVNILQEVHENEMADMTVPEIYSCRCGADREDGHFLCRECEEKIG